MSFEQSWSYVLQVGSISGLLSLIYTIIKEVLTKTREGPRLDISVNQCYPTCVDRRYPYPSENIGMTLTIRNRGTKPTSIESLALTVEEKTEGETVGRLVHAKPYVLPKTIEPDTTIVQEALFRLDEVIHDDSDCVLTLKTTHKELKVRCHTLPLAPPE